MSIGRFVYNKLCFDKNMSPQTETKTGAGFKAGVKDYRWWKFSSLLDSSIKYVVLLIPYIYIYVYELFFELIISIIL